MKKIYIALCIALLAFTSCRSFIEEWQPVFTFGENEPRQSRLFHETDLYKYGFEDNFISISELKAMYKGGGVELGGNIWIKGQVISSDRSGNIYRELYIQDKTGGIDVKIGKSSLYSEFSLGQWVYVYCTGLTLGAYNGMPQLGMEPDNTSTNEYETSYIDVQEIINQHVFRGVKADPVQPVEVTEADIKTALSKGYTGELWGKLVTVKGLRYKNEIFALVYPNPSMDHKSGNPENRVFLSDNGTWGITTWALSKAQYIAHVQAGDWDDAQVGSGNTRYGAITERPVDLIKAVGTLDLFGPDATLTYKEIMVKYATANYVSHYFTLGGTDVQVRTSGYSKFADVQLDDNIFYGHTCDITGILSIYSGAAQFSLVDEPSVSVKVN
ncbi:MAG: OB-fold nucleic acid binding domain-containing protein [Bacteroidales bacterium]|nr:OB-fold nucleic acid binding domain-containing protein [Bacteroidales bacterium]